MIGLLTVRRIYRWSSGSSFQTAMFSRDSSGLWKRVCCFSLPFFTAAKHHSRAASDDKASGDPPPPTRWSAAAPAHFDPTILKNQTYCKMSKNVCSVQLLKFGDLSWITWKTRHLTSTYVSTICVNNIHKLCYFQNHSVTLMHCVSAVWTSKPNTRLSCVVIMISSGNRTKYIFQTIWWWI